MHQIEIKKHHTLTTPQKYINIGNNPKIFFLAIYLLGQVRNKATYCVITILSCIIQQISDVNKKISYLNDFEIRPIAACINLVAYPALRAGWAKRLVQTPISCMSRALYIKIRKHHTLTPLE